MEFPSSIAIPLAAVAGYLLGSVNFAVIIAKRHGVDILRAGSGNPGATNVKRVIGKKQGNLVFALDALKGFVATFWPLGLALCGALARDHAVLPQLAGFAGALLGHCFSCFLGFKGGKGVAVTAGALLGLMPVNVAVCTLVWIILFFATRYVSVASVGTALALPAIAYLMPGGGPGPIFIFSCFIAAFIVYTHRSNLLRLLRGEENRFAKKS